MWLLAHAFVFAGDACNIADFDLGGDRKIEQRAFAEAAEQLKIVGAPPGIVHEVRSSSLVIEFFFREDLVARVLRTHQHQV